MGKPFGRTFRGRSGKTALPRPEVTVIQIAVVASPEAVGMDVAGYLLKACSPNDGVLVLRR